MDAFSSLTPFIAGLGGWFGKNKPPRGVTTFLAGIITALILFVVTSEVMLKIIAAVIDLADNLPVTMP